MTKNSEEMLRTVLKKMQNDTKKQVIRIEMNEESAGLTDSKVGGIPYLPKHANVPVDGEGRQMSLLAQINLSELPHNTVGLPDNGMLQFWVLDDEMSGLEFENLTESDRHCVTYWETIEKDVREADIKAKYHPYCEEEGCFPVQESYGITFSLEEEGISMCDYRYNDMAVEYWNREFPEQKVKNYFDLPDADDFYDDFCGGGSKIGGYPVFAQEDPRDSGLEKYQILLFQLDSSDEYAIMWGDMGVGNFFITEEKLKNRDFTNVLYTWDCY